MATLTARFDCLRRNTDGSEMADRTVEFRLGNVTTLAVGYDSAFLETRPSQFDPPRRITGDELADWPFRPQEAALSINSTVIEDALDSARLDWLAGDEPTLRDARCTLCLTFDQWGDFGKPMLPVQLLAGGDDLAITSGGLPLDLSEWAKEFEAWWTGWQEHWAARGEGGDDETGEYDTAIPAGEPEPPDLSYRPPAEPVFALEPTDAPPEVIRPVRDWFESQHERDWVRLARVYPCTQRSVKERAKELEEWNTGHNFGRWGYPRRIDQWWQEGRRACLVVRGIEHEMPLEGDPAENRETVWTFALRHRGGEWIIDTHEQGWPGFGSAPNLPVRQKPWLKQWRSGAVQM